VGGIVNTGGGGAGGTSANFGGGGGGAGEYVEITINSPASSIPFSVGAGGAGGVLSSAGGGAGGSGIIIVDELYPPIAAVAGTLAPISDNFLGLANGVTKTFTLSQTPASAAAISVYQDGLLLSGTSDYTFTPPTTITITTAPATACTAAIPSNCTWSLLANYNINTSTLPAAFILNSSQTVSGQTTFTQAVLISSWMAVGTSTPTISQAFPGEAIAAYGVVTSSGEYPTITACTGCNAGANPVTGTNQAGKVALQSGSGFTMTFSRPWHNITSCVMTAGSNNVAIEISALSNTAVSAFWSGGLTSIYYICWGMP
jgi:hypothetical protein